MFLMIITFSAPLLLYLKEEFRCLPALCSRYLRHLSASSKPRHRDAALSLVLPFLVLVRALAGLVALETEHVRDAFVRVDLRGPRRRARGRSRHVAFPVGPAP